MSLLSSFRRRHRVRLSSLVAVFVMAAQLVVALAPLGETRTSRSYSAHVEAAGTVAHLSHNEATCALCQARSILGSAPRRTFVLPEPVVHPTAIVADPVSTPATALYVHTSPRAPPSMI